MPASPEQNKLLTEELGKILTPALIPNPAERKGLIDEIVDTLKNVEIDDMKHPDTQKALQITCGMHLMKKNDPSLKFDPSSLFKQPENDKEEEKNLKTLFKELLEKMFKLTPTGKKKKKDEKDENKEENKLDKMAEEMALGLTKGAPVVKNDSALSLIGNCVDVLAAGIETQYGGVDIRYTGGTLKPVLGIPEGDRMGTQDLATQEGDNFKASLEKTHGEDYTGIKIFNLMESIAMGGEPPSAEELRNDHILPTPPSTAPRPKSPFDTH